LNINDTILIRFSIDSEVAYLHFNSMYLEGKFSYVVANFYLHFYSLLELYIQFVILLCTYVLASNSTYRNYRYLDILNRREK